MDSQIASDTKPGFPFEAPIGIRPRFSPTLAMVLAFIHGAALLLVLFGPFGSASKMVLAVAVALSANVVLRRHLFFLGDTVTAITLQPDGSFLVGLANGEVEKGELLPGAFVHPQLTVLVFRLARKRRRALLLTQDNVDPEAFRRLRVRLRV